VRYCIVGAGMQGAVMASVLARDPAAPHIKLCDADLARADRVAAHLRCERLTTTVVDGRDLGSLVEAAQGSDIVVNLVFFEMAATVRRAALAAGCHYVDSASDTAFLESIAYGRGVPDAREFAAAGSSAVVSCGWAPGVTNVLARRLCDGFDTVEELHVRLGFDRRLWVDPDEIAHPFRPHAGPEVLIADFAEESLRLTEGRPVAVPPFSLPETRDFGGRIGPLLLTSHVHDEPYTLPRLLGKGVQQCDFRYPLNEQAATLIAMGMGDPEKTVRLADGTIVKPYDVLMALVERPAESTLVGETPEALTRARDTDRAVEIDAVGTAGGRGRRRRLSWYITDSADLRRRLYDAYGSAQIWVALPLLVAALMILAGDVPPGVFLPEQLEPGRFLDELAKAGYPLDYRVDDLEEALAPA
jgi:saccharopine dehydrogenase-like NADP-dependent oxidoreductase